MKISIYFFYWIQVSRGPIFLLQYSGWQLIGKYIVILWSALYHSICTDMVEFQVSAHPLCLIWINIKKVWYSFILVKNVTAASDSGFSLISRILSGYKDLCDATIFHLTKFQVFSKFLLCLLLYRIINSSCKIYQTHRKFNSLWNLTAKCKTFCR